MMSAIYEPKEHTDNHDTTVHQNAVVHVFDVRVLSRRPHGPEGAEDGIQYRYDGDGDAEAPEPEGTPGDLGVRGSKALVEHDGCGEDEGGVVARYDEGDEGAETDGGADVDEGKEEINDSCRANGVKREVGALVDLESFGKQR